MSAASSSRRSGSRPDPSSRSAARSPATTAEAEEPRPRCSGMALRQASPNAGALPPSSRATKATVRNTRFVPSSGSSPTPSPSTVMAGRGASRSTVNSLKTSTARARQSNPGPRLATVAGVRMVNVEPRPVTGRAWRPRPRGRAPPPSGAPPPRWPSPVPSIHGRSARTRRWTPSPASPPRRS